MFLAVVKRLEIWHWMSASVTVGLADSEFAVVVSVDVDCILAASVVEELMKMGMITVERPFGRVSRGRV